MRRKLEKTNGNTIKVKTGCGELLVTISNGEGKEFEFFVKPSGKSGGCMAAQVEALGRSIGMSLKAGVEPKKIVSHLKDIACSSPIHEAKSCADAIARVIEEYLKSKKEK